MHNTLQLALNRIHSELPTSLLRLVFLPHNVNISLDEAIIEHIIRKRLLHDCNLRGGTEKQIVLEYRFLERTWKGPQESLAFIGQYGLYRIPPEVREGRALLPHPIAVTYPRSANYGHIDPARALRRGRTAGRLAREVLESITYARSQHAPTALVKGSDLIQMYPIQIAHSSWIVTVRLAYDEDFQCLNAEAVDPFLDLCLCATKAYIYKELVLEIDEGRILHGGEHGQLTNLVNKFESESEKYKELLDEFHGGTMLTPESMARWHHTLL
jgi:hypothetical protein